MILLDSNSNGDLIDAVGVQLYRSYIVKLWRFSVGDHTFKLADPWIFLAVHGFQLLTTLPFVIV